MRPMERLVPMVTGGNGWGAIETEQPAQPVCISPDYLGMIIRDELRGLCGVGFDLPSQTIGAVADAVVRRALAPQQEII